MSEQLQSNYYLKPRTPVDSREKGARILVLRPISVKLFTCRGGFFSISSGAAVKDADLRSVKRSARDKKEANNAP
tara:strand:+ start:410 stop:634 length:225 start_codon:yes stop_codon:yes gene_type:complete